jgi:TolA-binding protein
MSDTSAFIAGCATTGAAALMLLLARIGVSESPPNVGLETPPPLNEAVVPVPTPPPDMGVNLEAQEELLEALEQQQTTIEDLEGDLEQQQFLVRDLESQLQEQQAETQAIAARLDAYEQSVSTLSLQQQQLAGVQQTTDKTQASLLWVGAGLAIVVLVGGAVILLILVVLVAFQSRNRNTQASQIVYPADVPPPGYAYYHQEFLPPPNRPRRVQAQDIYDYD